jgi:hypothetical protein
VNKLTAYLLYTGILLWNTFLFSQEGKIWVRVADPAFREVVLNEDPKVSNDLVWSQLKDSFHIHSSRLALPSSRNVELQQVLELTCTCDEHELLQAITISGLPFIKPEIGPHYQTLSTPNDYHTQFANDYALDLIKAPQAWDITHGDTSVVIAITDANYYVWHEELVGKLNYVSDNFNSDYTHGTVVAITAAGNTNNGLGKSSIGYDSHLQLRVMDYNELLNATYSGAEIINLSWSSGCEYMDYPQAVVDEVYANGTVLIAAAGNGGTCAGASNLVYPASFNHVISVTSVGPNDNHERFIGNPGSTHQHNAMVDLSAPGYDVALSTAPGVYTTGNGTSFAAPYVAGLAALLFAVNPCLSPDEVEYILKTTSVNIDAQNPAYVGLIGTGRIDAQAAVQMASTFNTFSMSAQNTVNCAALTQGVNLNLAQGGTAPFSILWSNGMTNDTISGLSPGTYSVVVRDSNHCVASYMTTFEAMTPIVLTEAITHPLCYGEATGNISMQVNGGSPPYSPLWNTGETSTNISGLSAGTYFVIFSDQLGCSSAEIYQLTDPVLFEANLQETDIFYSAGGTIDLTVSGGTPPYVYDWSNGTTVQDQAGLTPGFYEVIIHDANGCELSLNTEVQIAHPYGPIDSPAEFGSATSVSGLGEGGEIPDFSCYYNNEKHEIHFSWVNGGSVEVLDLNGKLIYSDIHLSFKGDHRILMDAVGTYLVRFRNERGMKEFKLLVY